MTSSQNQTNHDLFGIMVEFDNAEDLLEAAHRVYADGFRKLDAYTPMPVHGLAEVIGERGSWVPFITLAGAILGGGGGYLLQFYTSVISYPLNIGGRPFHSWPAFLVITFETAVLGAAFAGVLGMLALNKLPMPYHPVFSAPRFQLASRDRFYLCILGTDPKFDPAETWQYLETFGAESVFEVAQRATRIYE